MATSIRAVEGRGELNGWWRFSAALVAPLVRLLFRVHVEGEDRVPASGAAILAGNHVSTLDGIVLAVVVARRTRRMTRFLVAAEYFAKPWLRPLLRSYVQIPVRRGARDLEALAEAERTLRSGGLAGIYPEGGINENPALGLRRGHSGVARLAIATGTPIIPVGIWGTQVRWPWAGPTLQRPLRTGLGLVFGEPIAPPTGDASPGSVQGCTDLVMARIAELTERARGLAEDTR